MTVDDITDTGVMTYTILKKANYDDFINIIFVVK